MESDSPDLGDAPLDFERHYETLHAMAQRAFRNERRDHTLQPTALIGELFARSQAVGGPPSGDQLARAARVMEQVLIDHARKKSARKRGGSWVRVDLDAEIAIDRPRPAAPLESLMDALDRLRKAYPRPARVAQLRLFSEMTMQAIADEIGLGKRSVENDWNFARTWLRRELSDVLEGPA